MYKLIQYILVCKSGCGAARLARVLWEHEAGGSNPLTPTSKIKKLEKTLTQKANGHLLGCVNLCQNSHLINFA